jgi:ERCC4-related helicase
MDVAYESGATELAKKISNALNKDFNQHLEYLASLGDMTKKQLEDILMNYNQQKYMEQIQEQQGGQPTRQADAYLAANLSGNQMGLSLEMNQLFNFMQYLKRIETDNNPAEDSINKKLDTVLSSLKADSNNPKGTDSPKTTQSK